MRTKVSRRMRGLGTERKANTNLPGALREPVAEEKWQRLVLEGDESLTIQANSVFLRQGTDQRIAQCRQVLSTRRDDVVACGAKIPGFGHDRSA
jgi:hypothetical protein